MQLDRLGRPSLPTPHFVIRLPRLLEPRHAHAAVLGQISEMHPHHVAQPAKLHAALVLPAEPQSRGGHAVIQTLQLAVGLENVQDGTVHLPEEFECRQEEGGLALDFLRVGGHGGKEDGVGSAGAVEVAVFSVVVIVARGFPRSRRSSVGGIPSLAVRRNGIDLPLLGGLLGGAALRLGLLDQVANHRLQTPRRLALTQIPILMQSVLRFPRPVEFEAQVEVGQDDLFVSGGPRFVAAGGEALVEETEGRVGLVDGDEFLGAAEGVFGFAQKGGVV
mmetsp:Transcript_26552/g.54706  ORF Transcript_26552/g.54706 Transcript_26552/m.54706 type:complete len:276 (+) Transcript_26552:2368-3195(+)